MTCLVRHTTLELGRDDQLSLDTIVPPYGNRFKGMTLHHDPHRFTRGVVEIV
jgi:hypothetical protein